jgi:hypothetical protein
MADFLPVFFAFDLSSSEMLKSLRELELPLETDFLTLEVAYLVDFVRVTGWPL